MLTTLRKKGKGRSAKQPEAIPASPELIALKPALGAGQGPSPSPGETLAPKVGDDSSGPDPALANAAKSAPTRHDVAVLSLAESGEILSARGSCMAVFGWDCSALSGKSIGLLLKGGLVNEVGTFLEQRRKGVKSAETVVLRVQVLRKDGGEFPASVTTPTWSLGTRLTQTTDTSHLGWTLAFRSVVDGTDTNVEAAGETGEKSAGETLSSVSAAGTSTPTGATTNDVKTTPVPASTQKEPIARRQSAGEDWFDSDGPDAVGPREKKAASPVASTSEPRANGSAEKDWFQRQVVEESNRRITELQTRLSQKDAELEQLKADLAKQKSDWERAESEWRRELDGVARAMGGKLETAATGWQEREKQSKDDLAAMRQERDALKQKLEAEQKLAGESNRLLRHAENQLRQAACDHDSIKAENGKHLEERSRLEFELRAQLDAAKEAGGYREAALKEVTLQREKLDQTNRELRREQIELTKRFEESIARLRTESDEIRAKLSTEQGASAQVLRRAEEAESMLTRTTAELAKVKDEFEKHRVEAERVESEWRKRLEAAQTRGEGQNKESEGQLDALRRERDQIQARLEAETQAAADAKRRCAEMESRLAGAASEVEKLKDEGEQLSSARQSTETKLRVELAEMTAAAASAKAELKEAIDKREALERIAAELKEQQVDLSKRFEMEAATFRKLSEELREQVAVERQALVESGRRVEEMQNCCTRSVAESEGLKAQLEQALAEREQKESDWRKQVEEAGAHSAKVEAAQAEVAELARQMECDLNDVRQERDELCRKVATEQFAVTESRRRIEELRARLHQATSEMDQAREKSSEQQAERQKAESQWQRQVAALSAKLQKAEAALAAALDREKAIEEDAAKLRLEREDFDNRSMAEHRTMAESNRRAEALERRLNQTAEELVRVQAVLDEQSLEGERMQAEWQQELIATRGRKEKAEMAWAEAAEQSKRLEEDLIGVRRECEELKEKLAEEQHATVESARRSEAAERRVAQKAEELERAQAEMDRRVEEYEGAESQWREHLAASKALNRKLEAAWSAATERGKGMEEDLLALRKEVEELGGKLTSEQLAVSELRRRAESSERRARQYALELERSKTAGEALPAQQGRAVSGSYSQRPSEKLISNEASEKPVERRDSPRRPSYSSPTTLFERYNLQP